MVLRVVIMLAMAMAGIIGIEGTLAKFTDTHSMGGNIFATSSDFPPAAATGLVATDGVGQVDLDWSDNIESDLAGYNVYRSAIPGGPYTIIGGSLSIPSSYIDSSVSSGTSYYYVVAAVDNGANESGYSNEDSATPTN